MQQTVNGLAADKLRATIDAIRNNPERGQLTLRARNRWVNGTHCRTTIDDYQLGGKEQSHKTAFVLDADEPPALLGEDRAPGATEALLYALASCLNTTLIYHATLRGIQVEELELDLDGDLDLRGLLGITDKVRNGFDTIRVTFRIKADATVEAMQELCRLAQQHSPVYDMVTHVTPVTASVEAKQSKPGQRKTA